VTPRVLVAAPPTAPKAYEPPAPTGKLFLIFGTLKKSPPPPNAKPITANKEEYVFLFSEEPSQRRHPSGAEEPANIVIDPVGDPMRPPDGDVKDPLIVTLLQFN